MKNYFGILLICLFLIFVTPGNIFSQDNQTIFDELKLIGINCGYASLPNKNSCCQVIHPSFSPPSFFSSSPVLQPLVGLFDYIGKFYSQFIIQYFNKESKELLCVEGIPDDPSSKSCKCIPSGIVEGENNLKTLTKFCQQQSNLADRKSCLLCINEGGVYTGIGCIQTNFALFINKTVFGLGIGLAGGFALLCIIYAAFQMQSSQGNPEKLKKAQEMITSCIMGLMLIIFSVFILRLIGVNILRIPGFE